MPLSSEIGDLDVASEIRTFGLPPRRSPRGFRLPAIDEFYTWLHVSIGNRRMSVSDIQPAGARRARCGRPHFSSGHDKWFREGSPKSWRALPSLCCPCGSAALFGDGVG